MTSQGHDEPGALRAGARQRAAVAQAQEQSRRPGEQRHLTAETNAVTGRSTATVAARLPRIQTGRRHSLLSVFQRTSTSLVSNSESIVLYVYGSQIFVLDDEVIERLSSANTSPVADDTRSDDGYDDRKYSLSYRQPLPPIGKRTKR